MRPSSTQTSRFGWNPSPSKTFTPTIAKLVSGVSSAGSGVRGSGRAARTPTNTAAQIPASVTLRATVPVPPVIPCLLT